LNRLEFLARTPNGSELLVTLGGDVGVGKSSFVNRVIPPAQNLAFVEESRKGSVTEKVTIYTVCDCLRVIDVPGAESGDIAPIYARISWTLKQNGMGFHHVYEEKLATSLQLFEYVLVVTNAKLWVTDPAGNWNPNFMLNILKSYDGVCHAKDRKMGIIFTHIDQCVNISKSDLAALALNATNVERFDSAVRAWVETNDIGKKVSSLSGELQHGSLATFCRRVIGSQNIYRVCVVGRKATEQAAPILSFIALRAMEANLASVFQS